MRRKINYKIVQNKTLLLENVDNNKSYPYYIHYICMDLYVLKITKYTLKNLK